MTKTEILITILIVCIVTFLLRALPFLIFRNKEKVPPIILYLGSYFPAAIFGFLVIYCLKGVSFSSVSSYLPSFISIVYIVLIHLWKKNYLLSILSGTLLYMILVQFVF